MRVGGQGIAEGEVRISGEGERMRSEEGITRGKEEERKE